MPIYLGRPKRDKNSFIQSGSDLGEEAYVPWETRRRRQQVAEMLRRMGTPALLKHRYSDLDVREGVAQKAPGRDSIYGQARNNDPLTLGTGYTSVELSTNEWFDNEGKIVISETSPGAEYQQVPRYRGFGPGHLIYVIMPDAARDYFTYDPGGAFYNIEESRAITSWTPKIWDGDLLITVTTDAIGNIISKEEVYECNKVTPLTMRGRDRLGLPEKPNDSNYFNTPNRWIMNQKFTIIKIPDLDPRQEVQIDR